MIKAEVRQMLLKRRGEVSDRDKKDFQIFERLREIVDKTKPESVFCYVSMGSEVDTKRFIKSIFGKIPVYVPFTEDKIMTPRLLMDTTDLRTDKLGNIKEIYLGNSIDNCPLTVIPMVSFNRDSIRMGYGGGYYDKYLSSHDTLSVGIAYQEQLFEELPVDSYDAKMNLIITQENYYL